MKERIKQMRKTLNITMRDLARLCEVSFQAVYLWECGKTKKLTNHNLLTLMEEFEKLETISDMEKFKKRYNIT